MNGEDKTQNKEIRELRDLMIKHISADDEIQQKILEKLESIDGKIKPMIEDYAAVGKLSKWIVGFLGVIALVIGIVTGIITVIKNFTK